VDFGGPLLATDGALFTSWNFGDGTPFSFSPDGAAHIYNAPGVYTVTLFVENAGGCVQTVVKTNYITVVASPTLSVSATNTCTGNRGIVTFGVAAGGGATGLAWDFGDGMTQNTSASITQLTHTYTQNQTYIATVTAGSGTCSITSSQNVTALIEPTLVFSADAASVCPNGTVNVTLSEPGTSYSWYPIGINALFEYGDRTIAQASPVNTVADAYGGDYSWTLTGLQGGENGLRVVTTNNLGCVDSSNFIPLVVGGAATGYEIQQDDRCYQLPVLLKDTTKVATGNSIVSWLWDFGDGQTSTQSGVVSHTYAAPGGYTVKLTVQDASGCQASSVIP
jgi:PKD repeat protein